LGLLPPPLPPHFGEIFFVFCKARVQVHLLRQFPELNLLLHQGQTDHSLACENREKWQKNQKKKQKIFLPFFDISPKNRPHLTQKNQNPMKFGLVYAENQLVKDLSFFCDFSIFQKPIKSGKIDMQI
jgi:hypothetical protein